MGHGDYERLTPEAIDEVWLRLRAGQAAKPTARSSGCAPGTVRAYLLRCGGIRPEPRRRAAGRLRLEEREEISRGLAAGLSIRAIAAGVGQVAVDGEPRGQRQRWAGGGTGRRVPTVQAWARATRPKPCKLADNPALRAIVEEKLQRRWSPQQIAGWLKLTYPDEPGDAGVAREHLPHPVRAVARRAAQGADPLPAHRPGDPPSRKASACPTVAVAGRTRCTSPNDQPRPTTVRCPGTGKATWSSART